MSSSSSSSNVNQTPHPTTGHTGTTAPSNLTCPAYNAPIFLTPPQEEAFKTAFEAYAVANFPALTSTTVQPQYVDSAGTTQDALTLLPPAPAEPTALGSRSSDLPLPGQPLPGVVPLPATPLVPMVNTSLRVVSACRTFSAKVRTSNDREFLLLDPLAKIFKDLPACADGLCIISQDFHGQFVLWQLHSYSEHTRVFQLTEIGAADPVTIPFAITDLADCCTFNSEFARGYLTKPSDGSPLFVPHPERLLAIRFSLNNAQKRVYDFVEVHTGHTVYTATVPLPGRTHRSTAAGDDTKTGHTTAALSDATMAYMDITRDQLSAKTGTQLLHDMRTRLSAVESTELGSDSSLADRPLMTTYVTAQDALQFKIRDIADFRSAPTGDQADTATSTKHQGPRLVSLMATTSLSDYHNLCLLWCRGFELSPHSALTKGIFALDSSMLSFIRQRETTEPDLATNGFCGKYLNLAVQALTRVLAQPTSTNQDILTILATLHVTDTTPYYVQTHASLVAQERKDIQSLRTEVRTMLATRNHGQLSTSETTPNPTKIPRTGTRAAAGGAGAKSPHALCYYSYTTVGCKSTKCKTDHSVKPTPVQITAMQAWLTRTNARSPGKEPLVLDPARVAL